MPDLIKFSDLTGVLTLNDSDLLAIAAENESSETGFTSVKSTVRQMATKVAEGTTFSALTTESKYIVPSINEIKELISQIPQFDVQVVQTLPVTGVTGTVYLVPAQEGSSPNLYEEYLWVNNQWEKLGSASVDLSNYYNKTQINGMLADEYNTSESYSVGDYVIYNNYLYRCIGDTSGVWDSTKWTIVKLTIEMPKNLGDLQNVNITSPTHRQGLVYDNPTGKWINGSVGGSAESTSYDNTESGLSADNVQEAIDELEENIEGITEPQKTVSGSVVTFSDSLPNSPLLACKASIEATQSGSGTPSPDNPRPITGFDTVIVTVKDSDDVTQSTHTVSLGQTVGRGTLNVTTGELTITDKIIDMGSVAWSKNTSNGCFTTTLSDIFTPTTGDQRNKGFLCEVYKPSTTITIDTTSPEDKSILVYTGGLVFIRDTDISTAGDFKTSVTGKKFMYKLATPVTVQLTPEEILTITGENNISANSGDIEVTYRTPFYVSANSTSYDNSTSGLVATNVQEAIDELAENSGGSSYSTEEQIVGTWIDGKTLYERTFDCGYLPNGTTKEVNIDSNVMPVRYWGIAINTKDSESGQTTRALPFLDSDTANMIRVDTQRSGSSASIRIKTYTSWAFYYAYVTIQYTKTTD